MGYSCHVLVLVLLYSISSTLSMPYLKVGYYDYSCPQAEAIVRKAVQDAMYRNPALAPALIRMHFHDCFIRGCDASVLIKSTPGNPSERESIANNPSLKGFEVIEEAKSQIEAVCPGTVSCADIIAFAARDSSHKLGGSNYAVPSGRRDGCISNASEVIQNLPAPFFNAEQLIESFARKGLSVDDMVTLSGAHSVGVSHCSSFSSRLFPTNSTPTLHSSLSKFEENLKVKCPEPNSNQTVSLDHVTPARLDNVYYIELTRGHGLLASDQTLYSSAPTQRKVLWNARYGRLWAANFAKAMVRMGYIDVLTGSQGEIRRKCSVVN